MAASSLHALALSLLLATFVAASPPATPRKSAGRRAATAPAASKVTTHKLDEVALEYLESSSSCLFAPAVVTFRYPSGWGAESLAFEDMCLLMADDLVLNLQRDPGVCWVVFQKAPSFVGQLSPKIMKLRLDSIPSFSARHAILSTLYPGPLAQASHQGEFDGNLRVVRDSLRLRVAFANGAIWRVRRRYNLTMADYRTDRGGFEVWKSRIPHLIRCPAEVADSLLKVGLGKIPGEEYRYFLLRNMESKSTYVGRREDDPRWPGVRMEYQYTIGPGQEELGARWAPLHPGALPEVDWVTAGVSSQLERAALAKASRADSNPTSQNIVKCAQ